MKLEDACNILGLISQSARYKDEERATALLVAELIDKAIHTGSATEHTHCQASADQLCKLLGDISGTLTDAEHELLKEHLLTERELARFDFTVDLYRQAQRRVHG